MEDIIKLQIKAIEVKLTIAKAGRKEELEAKIKKLKGLVTPVATDDKATRQAARQEARRKRREEVKEELPLIVQKKIKKEMIELKADLVEIPKKGKTYSELMEEALEPIVEKPIEIVVADKIEEVIVVEELPTIEEIEKEIIESEPIVEAPKHENIPVDGSDKEEAIQPDEPKEEIVEIPVVDFILEEPKEEVVEVPVVEALVVEPPKEEKIVPVVVKIKETIKKPKRKYTRKKAPRKMPAKK